MSKEITRLIEDIDKVIFSPEPLSEEDLPLISKLCWEAIRHGDDYVDEKLSDYQAKIAHIRSLKHPARKSVLVGELVRGLRLASKQLSTILAKKNG
jgi:hypothetical protein